MPKSWQSSPNTMNFISHTSFCGVYNDHDHDLHELDHLCEVAKKPPKFSAFTSQGKSKVTYSSTLNTDLYLLAAKIDCDGS